MKFEDIKIGDHLVLNSDVVANHLRKGDVVVVSDKTVSKDQYVYVNGHKNNSGMGICPYAFEPYVAPKSKLDFTKPLQTTEGIPVVLITTTGRNKEYPVLAYIGDSTNPAHYTADGKYVEGSRNPKDLENAPPPKKEVVRWFNVYEDHVSIGYKTPSAARLGAGTDIIGRKRVVFTEGEWDE